MQETGKLQVPKERAAWALIGVGLRGLAAGIMNIGKKDPLIGRALKEFDGIYRIENADGKLFHFLVFQNGKAKVPRNWVGPADFTFTLYEPPAFYLRTKPEDLLKMAISNKIGQKGNLYYLFQFGFIMSLVERYFKMKKLRGNPQAG